jgi:hypothetical protein
MPLVKLRIERRADDLRDFADIAVSGCDSHNLGLWSLDLGLLVNP